MTNKITQKQLDNLMTTFDNLPKIEKPKEYSDIEAAVKLKPKIKEAIRKNYSHQQIISILHKAGIKIDESQLNEIIQPKSKKVISSSNSQDK